MLTMMVPSSIHSSRGRYPPSIWNGRVKRMLNVITIGRMLDITIGNITMLSIIMHTIVRMLNIGNIGRMLSIGNITRHVSKRWRFVWRAMETVSTVRCRCA